MLVSYLMAPDPTIVLLKNLRASLGLTQRALGQHLGVTARTVNRWENGSTEIPASAIPRAIALLRERDPQAADRLAIEAKLPGALAQEEARRAALDHAVYAAADALDVSPRRAREVLSAFLTHLVAAGLVAADARARLVERVAADAQQGAPTASKP
jgi:transcriptional regulator with XRE-family HTH domain